MTLMLWVGSTAVMLALLGMLALRACRELLGIELKAPRMRPIVRASFLQDVDKSIAHRAGDIYPPCVRAERTKVHRPRSRGFDKITKYSRKTVGICRHRSDYVNKKLPIFAGFLLQMNRCYGKL